MDSGVPGLEMSGVMGTGMGFLLMGWNVPEVIEYTDTNILEPQKCAL